MQKSKEIMIENIKTAIKTYINTINFKKTEISYARLLNITIGCNGVNDTTDFKLNDSYTNVTCEETEIFSLIEFDMEVE